MIICDIDIVHKVEIDLEIKTFIMTHLLHSIKMLFLGVYKHVLMDFYFSPSKIGEENVSACCLIRPILDTWSIVQFINLFKKFIKTYFSIDEQGSNSDLCRQESYLLQQSLLPSDVGDPL